MYTPFNLDGDEWGVLAGYSKRLNDKKGKLIKTSRTSLGQHQIEKNDNLPASTHQDLV